MLNYYNENDKFAANWLKELIKAKLIPEGEVDDRSILDVEPQDLVYFNQHHFFAGIGGWPYAFKLSGWNAERHVWSGSCPCQSLSCAGKGLGEKDERHLWPVFFGLIEKLRPATVFGEQVASKDGREWLSGVRNDLEAVGYAVGAADLPAASVKKKHIRRRLFWVANSKGINNDVTGNVKTRKITKQGVWGIQPRRQDLQTDDFTWNPKRKQNVESAICSRSDGLPGRVGLLRGAGNAIVPQVAAEFIKAFMET